MKISELKGKNILLVGYGKEGQATEKFLKSRLTNVKISIADQNNGEDYLKNQKDYDLAVRSPGVPKEVIKIPYTTATNIFFANKGNIDVIGVTGTKGKSTTASLIHHIFSKDGITSKLVGNIGIPMLEVLMDNHDDKTIFVCELSSYQLDDVKFSPHIAVVVSLFSDHLPYHGSIDKYHDAKKNIVRYQTEKDYFIYNPRFAELTKWSNETNAKSLPYTVFQMSSSIALKGEHNHDNIRAAATVTKLYDIPDETIKSALVSFQPLPHRLEYVGKYHNIDFYDDAISTTPESTIAALEALSDVKTIFLGGLDRGYDFTNLIEVLKKNNVQNIVLFPDTGDRIKQLLEKEVEYHPKIFETRKMNSAIEFAFTNTPRNSVCLLSTASPSYSLWKNFEEKGDEFQNFVKNYAK